MDIFLSLKFLWEHFQHLYSISLYTCILVYLHITLLLDIILFSSFHCNIMLQWISLNIILCVSNRSFLKKLYSAWENHLMVGICNICLRLPILDFITYSLTFVLSWDSVSRQGLLFNDGFYFQFQGFCLICSVQYIAPLKALPIVILFQQSEKTLFVTALSFLCGAWAFL